MTERRIRLLALDPSFTATGWVVVDLLAAPEGKIIGCGVIATQKAKAKEKLTAAQDDAARGSIIRRGISRVCDTFEPVVVVQEGASGSKSARAASALARGQQSCVDAVDVYLGTTPLIVTQQAVKIAAVGRHMQVTKGQLEKAACRRWPGTDWLRLIVAGPTPIPPDGEHENIYDAACVAACAWDLPTVAMARRL